MLDGRRLLGLPANAVPVLAIAFLASFIIYWPALRTDFVGDDYFLLLASREMGWGEFLRATWDPNADPGVLQLSANYWRPLSYLLFRVTHVFAGDNPLPYHLVNLGIHLAGIAVIYALAHRLTRNELGAAVAAFIFAVHPAGFESITWIAALNSAALPLMLGSWLAFAVAVDGPAFRRTPFAVSLLLLAAALAFRETAAAVAMAMLIWYVFGPARQRLTERSTWLIGGTVTGIVAAHAVIFVGIFSDEAGRPLWDISSQGIDRTWYYVRQAVLPTNTPHGLLVWLQRGLAVAFLAVLALAAVRRQWPIAALGLGFLVAIIPYAFFSLGLGPRYLYLPSAVFALCIGATASRLPELLPVPKGPTVRLVAAAVAVFVLVATPVTLGRIQNWVNDYPDQNESWVDGLVRQYPELPEGAGIWVVDPPLVLALLDGYIIPPIIHYLYDEQPQVYVISSEHLDFARSVQEPDDIFYIWEGSPAAGTLD